jgi:hypothetical protein
MMIVQPRRAKVDRSLLFSSLLFLIGSQVFLCVFPLLNFILLPGRGPGVGDWTCMTEAASVRAGG